MAFPARLSCQVMLQNRDVGQLLLILAIAEHGSINKAAEALYISQPALTRTVRDFETAIGGKVFERSAKGVRLTPVGEALIDHARAIRAEFLGAMRDAEGVHRDGRQHMYIAAAPYHPLPPLARALGSIMATRPTLELHLRYGPPDALVGWLDSGEVEMVLGPLLTGAAAHGYVQEVLYYDELAVYCAADHPLAALASVGLDDLRGAEWVLGPPGSFVRERVEGLFFNEAISPPHVRLEVEDVATRRSLVTHAAYVSAFQRNQIHSVVEPGLVAAVNYHWPQDQRAIGVIRLVPHTELSRLVAGTLHEHYRAGGMRMTPHAAASDQVRDTPAALR